MKTLLIWAAPLLAALQEPKVELRWRFEKGQELVYKTSRKDLRTVKGQATETELSSTYSWTVTDVAPDGKASITAKYLAVSFWANRPAPYEYDSEKDREPPPGGPGVTLAKLLGRTFTLTITPRGRVEEVKGFDAIFEALAKDLPAGAEGERLSMKQALSDEAFRAALDQMSSSLPEGPVGVGDAWKGEYSAAMPPVGTLRYEIGSKLADLRDGDARIEQEVRIVFKPGEGEGPALEVRDARGKGTSVFSTRRGRFQSQKSESEMTLVQGGREMKVETQIEVKVAERKKAP